MSKIIKGFSFILPFFILISCKNPVSLENNPTPGRRDYTWTVDTIHVPLSYIRDMWGSDPNDIWAVSDGSSDSCIFHYNGIKWTCDGIFRNILPNSIFGFSANNVWIGGVNGRLWHFDGSIWSEFTTLNYLPDNQTCWEGIWGKSSNDVYAVGSDLDENYLFNKGVIAHFDGIKWELLQNSKINISSVRIYQSPQDNKLYLYGSHWSQLGDTNYILQYDGHSIKAIYSGTNSVNQSPFVSFIGNEILFVLGRRIVSFTGSEFKDIAYISGSFVNGFQGRSRNDLFLWMLDGLAHYNGSDIQYLYRINSNTRLGPAIIFDKQIIIAAADFNSGNSLIIKGELK